MPGLLLYTKHLNTPLRQEFAAQNPSSNSFRVQREILIVQAREQCPEQYKMILELTINSKPY